MAGKVGAKRVDWTLYDEHVIKMFHDGFRAKVIFKKLQEAFDVSFSEAAVSGRIWELKKVGKLPNVSYLLCERCGDKCRNLSNRQRWCRKCIGDDTRSRAAFYFFGITPDQYTQMLSEQQNRCKICNVEFLGERSKICIDHNHSTGKVRGLLCQGCNTGLGVVERAENWLDKALQYLKDSDG